MTTPATRSDAILGLRDEVLRNGGTADVVVISRDDAEALCYELSMPRVDIIHGLRVHVDRGMRPGWFLVLAKSDFKRIRAVKQTMTPRAWREKLAEEFGPEESAG